jgi:O-succinylbenzoic acid--CoA ligase
MKLEQNKLHKNFKLNGFSFSSVDELFAYTKDLHDEIHQFLESWFSVDQNITVQTSGSTGAPKLILLKKEFFVNSAKATGNYFNLKEHTTALLCLPTKYIAGKLMLIRAITLGWELDVIESNSNPLEKVNKRYDFSAMVPLQLENSLLKLHFIKKLIVGGGLVSKELEHKIKHVSTAIFATYGMTETVTHIAVRQLNKHFPLQVRVKKQSFSDNEISSLKYANINAFYQILPGVTIYKDKRNCLVIDAPKVSDEIIFTNDVVQLISDNKFKWLGRFDNVINSGGIKLHPEKIEEKLSSIITNRFFVTGIPDEKLGEKLVLIIEGKKQVINYKTLGFSKLEIPKVVYFLEQFVETKTKKIQRKKTLDLLKL